jgi:serine/threonine protein kinase
MMEFARGANGIIYFADHIRLGPVAVKKVQNDDQGRRESEMLRRVAEANGGCPRHVCRLYESFEDGLDFCMVLERFRAPLDTYCYNKSSPHSLISIGLESAKGILEMDRAGIVDDDVKPANMSITESGRLAHIDLGCARPFGQPPLGFTVEYVAPEIEAQIASNTSPIFSWGRCMEFFALGSPGLAPANMLCDRLGWIGRKFSDLIMLCCHPEPGLRPTPGELVAAMREIRNASVRCAHCPEGYYRFADAPCRVCGGNS